MEKYISRKQVDLNGYRQNRIVNFESLAFLLPSTFSSTHMRTACTGFSGYGDGISLISSLVFGILKKIRPEFRGSKYAQGRDAKNNHRDYGIARNFGSGRTLLGTLFT